MEQLVEGNEACSNRENHPEPRVRIEANSCPTYPAPYRSERTSILSPKPRLKTIELRAKRLEYGIRVAEIAMLPLGK